MYEHLHDFPESHDLSPHEAGSRNSQRRSLRYKPEKERWREAKAAQAASGTRVRIWRKVLNEDAFAKELRVWHPAQQNGVARRKNYRELTLTVFDTGQTPLRSCDVNSDEELREQLEWQHPGLFEQIGPMAVAGTGIFGNGAAPFIALQFKPGRLHDEQRTILRTVAPELWIDDSHQRIHLPHVSLGKIIVPDAVERARITGELMAQLEPVVPTEVELGPVHVDVTRTQ